MSNIIDNNTLAPDFEKGATKLTRDHIYEMHDAAKTGNAKRLLELLESGMPVDTPTRWGITPLLAAAGEGQAECVKILIAHKANLNATDRTTHTPLMRAEKNGHLEVAELLRKAGADSELKTFYGYKASDLAPK